MGFLTHKRATSHTPQVIALIIDDSGSMRENDKATQATASVQDLLIQLQASTQGASGWRFLLNIAKFGDNITEIAVASPPLEIDFNSIAFAATGGATEMPKALQWAAWAIEQSLHKCRQLPGYDETNAPNPLCVFFSDGKNTSRDSVPNSAMALRSIPFTGGNVDVVACGIGMNPNDFPIMQQIASRPELAANIDPYRLGDFIAEVGATVQYDRNAVDLLRNTEQYYYD